MLHINQFEDLFPGQSNYIKYVIVNVVISENFIPCQDVNYFMDRIKIKE